MTDLSHLNALQTSLSHENARVEAAKTEKERAWRLHNVMMITREIEAEHKFLGISPLSLEDILMTDDELLAALA